MQSFPYLLEQLSTTSEKGNERTEQLVRHRAGSEALENLQLLLSSIFTEVIIPTLFNDTPSQINVHRFGDL